MAEDLAWLLIQPVLSSVEGHKQQYRGPGHHSCIPTRGVRRGRHHPWCRCFQGTEWAQRSLSSICVGSCLPHFLDFLPAKMWQVYKAICTVGRRRLPYQYGPRSHRLALTNLFLQAASLSCLHLIAYFASGFIAAYSCILRQMKDCLGEYHFNVMSP